MKNLLRSAILILAFTSMAFSASVEAGMPEAKLIELKGAPQTKAKMGDKAIYRWPDMQVTLVDGVVKEIQLRDRVTEKQNAAERAAAISKQKADAKAEARQAAADERQAAASRKQAANAAENAQDRRLSRAVYLQAQIRGYERELELDSKRSSFKGPPPMSSEARALLNIRLEKARAELAGLK